MAVLMLVMAQWFGPWVAHVDDGQRPRPPITESRPRPVPAIAAQEPVDIASDEVDASGHYDIVIDQVDEEIDVEAAIDLTFRKPNQRVGNVIYEYYLTDWFLIVPASATGLEVHDQSGALDFAVESGEVAGLSVVTIGLRRNLFNGRSAEITISYSLPSAPPPVDLPGSEGLLLEEPVVVNDATAGWSFFSDPGLDSWTATIHLPAGFDEVGLDVESNIWIDGVGESDSTSRTLEASGQSFLYDFVVVENDLAMLETAVDLQGAEITVRYWPGDDAWRDRVVEQITENLPVMTELVDRPWPSRSLVVQESAETLGTTYGGWYTSKDNHITIGPSVDANLILHELAHVWFNFDVFRDRWLIEGLAEEFATLSAADAPADSGGDDASAGDAALNSPYAVPLRSWGWQDPGADYSEEEWRDATEREAWGYDASSYTIGRTREIIGLEAFSEVTANALRGRRSYPGPGTGADDDQTATGVDGRVHRGPTWEEFLDLASEHGPDQDLSELYARWVEGDMSPRFAARTAQRDRFQAITDRLGGWVLPEAVRRPMRQWRFDEAAVALDVTDRFADGLEAGSADLGRIGLALPDDVGERLAAIQQVDDVDDYDRELAAAVSDIVAFETAADGLTVIERIGLLGSDFGQRRSEARARFASGDFEPASSSISEGREVLEGADRRGRSRLIGGAATLMVLVGTAAWIRRRRRRRRPSVESSGRVDESEVKPAAEEIV